MIIVLVPMVLGFGGSLTAKFVFMNNQLRMVRQTLIDLNPDELHYYPFIISLYSCNWSYNIAEAKFGRICVPNKVEDVNLKIFNMVKGKNESKIIAKYISCKCRCKFPSRKCNSIQKWNKGKCIKRITLVYAPGSVTKIVKLVNT